LAIASRLPSRGDGLPGLAIFSLLALLLVLALAALASVHPWQTETRGPRLSVAPDLGAELGDAVAVAHPKPQQGPAVALASAEPAIPVSSVSTRHAGEQVGLEPAVAVAAPEAPGPAQPAPAAPVVAEPAPPAEQPIAAAPAPAPPAAVPAPPDTSGSGSPPPISAGGPEPAPEETCEGDEYEVTVRVLSETDESGEVKVEIVIRRVGDEEEEEVRLEGGLADVRELLDLIASEGDCVTVVFESAPPTEAPEPVLP